jgi:hypothetical protein
VGGLLLTEGTGPGPQQMAQHPAQTLGFLQVLKGYRIPSRPVSALDRLIPALSVSSDSLISVLVSLGSVSIG